MLTETATRTVGASQRRARSCTPSVRTPSMPNPTNTDTHNAQAIVTRLGITSEMPGSLLTTFPIPSRL